MRRFRSGDGSRQTSHHGVLVAIISLLAAGCKERRSRRVQKSCGEYQFAEQRFLEPAFASSLGLFLLTGPRSHNWSTISAGCSFRWVMLIPDRPEVVDQRSKRPE